MAWDKEIGCTCGAGMPSKCNSGEEPDVSQVVEEKSVLRSTSMRKRRWATGNIF
jgi:hypothetical protein